MKNYIFYFVLLMNMVALQAQSTDRDPSAALEVRSTTQGFLPPRMSTAQRVAIVSPTDGLIVYDNDLSKMMFRANGKWVAIGSTALASPLTASLTYNTGFTQLGSGFGSIPNILRVSLLNHGFSSAIVALNGNQITTSGVDGLHFSNPQPATVTLAPGQSQTVSFTVGGWPQRPGGTLLTRFTTDLLTETTSNTVPDLLPRIKATAAWVPDFVNGQAIPRELQVTLTHTSTSNLAPVIQSVATSDIRLNTAALTHFPGLSITAVSVAPPGLTTTGLAPGNTATITYKLGGWPTHQSTQTLTARTKTYDQAGTTEPITNTLGLYGKRVVATAQLRPGPFTANSKPSHVRVNLNNRGNEDLTYTLNNTHMSYHSFPGFTVGTPSPTTLSLAGRSNQNVDFPITGWPPANTATQTFRATFTPPNDNGITGNATTSQANVKLLSPWQTALSFTNSTTTFDIAIAFTNNDSASRSLTLAAADLSYTLNGAVANRFTTTAVSPNPLTVPGGETRTATYTVGNSKADEAITDTLRVTYSDSSGNTLPPLDNSVEHNDFNPLFYTKLSFTNTTTLFGISAQFVNNDSRSYTLALATGDLSFSGATASRFTVSSVSPTTVAIPAGQTGTATYSITNSDSVDSITTTLTASFGHTVAQAASVSGNSFVNGIWHQAPGTSGQQFYQFIRSSQTSRVWLDRNLGATRAATGAADVPTTTDNRGLGRYYTRADALNACPSGFHLPSRTEWNAELTGFSSGDRHIGAYNQLKLIRAGYIKTATSGPTADSRVGEYGWYWAATGDYVFLGFAVNDSTMYGAGREYGGLSARCIKD